MAGQRRVQAAIQFVDQKDLPRRLLPHGEESRQQVDHVQGAIRLPGHVEGRLAPVFSDMDRDHFLGGQLA